MIKSESSETEDRRNQCFQLPSSASLIISEASTQPTTRISWRRRQSNLSQSPTQSNHATLQSTLSLQQQQQQQRLCINDTLILIISIVGVGCRLPSHQSIHHPNTPGPQQMVIPGEADGLGHSVEGPAASRALRRDSCPRLLPGGGGGA